MSYNKASLKGSRRLWQDVAKSINTTKMTRTTQPAPLSTVLREKLIVAQRFKKFTAFYEPEGSSPYLQGPKPVSILG
jgi:hypothetical protein